MVSPVGFDYFTFVAESREALDVDVSIREVSRNVLQDLALGFSRFCDREGSEIGIVDFILKQRPFITY